MIAYGTMTLMIGALMFVPAAASSQGQPTGFLDRTTTVEGQTFRYQVYVPRDYDPGRAWPVILFLHGAGERGSDGLLQTEVGLPSAIRRAPAGYPAIVVAPQVPLDGSWQGRPGQAAMQALDRTLEEFSTDPTRVYLTGMSMGGNGSWYLAYRHPERFAAVAVVCGFVARQGEWPEFVSRGEGTPFERVAARVDHLPIWIAHGEDDTLVPASESRGMHEALRATGADVRYIELPGVGHNAWDPTYRDPEFAEWLFAQGGR
jgi:predicted peptidase